LLQELDSRSGNNVSHLLTEKSSAPKIWSVIERKLNNYHVHFFVSGDRELQSKLNLSAFLGIYFRKNNNVVRFEGKMDVKSGFQFIENQLSNNSEL
jgi:hypothetical protein